MILEDMMNLEKHGKGKYKIDKRCKYKHLFRGVQFYNFLKSNILVRTDLNVSCHPTEGILQPVLEFQVWIVVCSRPEYAFSPVSF
jgi:hypothetical protein